MCVEVTIVITGGGGFLGQCLATSLLKDPMVRLSNKEDKKKDEDEDEDEVDAKVTRIVLADVAFPPRHELHVAVRDGVESGIVACRVGSVADNDFCASLMQDAAAAVGGGATEGDAPSRGRVSVFHLGAVMSGAGEADFDLCMDVNLRGTVSLLEQCRRLSSPGPGSLPATRFVYASAGATIGAGAATDHVSSADAVSDATRAAPHTTYGATKACGELLLSDYSRRSLVDGRGVRLPTVAVRAGRPNAATTGCFSAVVREPLAGRSAVMPIGPHVKHAITGTASAVAALRVLHDASPRRVRSVLGCDRTVFVPALAASLSDLHRAVLDAVDPATAPLLGTVAYQPDDVLSAIVGSFPTRIDARRALMLGVPAAPTCDDIVRDYAAAFPSAIADGVRFLPPVASSAPEPQQSSHNVVAVITGAGTGIGRAVALRLAKGHWGPRPDLSPSETDRTYCLVLAGRRLDPLKETASLIEHSSSCSVAKVSCLPFSADVTDESAVVALFQRAVQTYGRVDLLFNNAGTNIPPTPILEYQSSDFTRILNTNLTASFVCAREAMRIMAKRQQPRGGRIINNGSISANVPRPGGVGYTCSKSGMVGLTKTLALEGRSYDVAVGQVDFGNVTTAVSDITQGSAGAPQPDGTLMKEPQMLDVDAANTVAAMAALPLSSNVLRMTVMATNMPFVGRG